MPDANTQSGGSGNGGTGNTGSDGASGDGGLLQQTFGVEGGDNKAAPGQTQAPGTVDAKKDGAPGKDGEGKQTDAGQKDAKKDGEQNAAPKPLELKKPDGSDIDDETLGQFKKLGEELGLDSPKAQKALDFMAKAQAAAEKRMQSEFQKTAAGWVAELKADKEFGGEKLAGNLKLADAAMKKYAPELAAFLKDSPLKAHPAVVKSFIRIGLADQDDSVTTAQPTKQGAEKLSELERLKRAYPNSPELFAMTPRS